MPKIFEYFGFIFYFYSNEHEPIHVHVIHGGKESIFDIIMMDGALAGITIREKRGAEPLTDKDKRTAEEFIRKYLDSIYITKAENAGNLTVCLTFNDNTQQMIDIGDYIRRHPHPQYNKYLDPRKFSRFTIENGNIVWGKNWDLIFPLEQLHTGTIL